MSSSSYALAGRLLSLATPLGGDTLLPESFEGRERLSGLFEIHVQALAVAGTRVSAASLIGNRATLGILVEASGTQRYLNGIVASLELLGSDTFFDTYRLLLVPSLWLLSLNMQTRVFQNQTVVEIVKAVLSPYSITPQDDTQATYTALDYCTQYRETDLNFVLRLMQQHGIYFYFTHTSTAHTMVLGDTSAQLPATPTQSTFPYSTEKEGFAGIYDKVVDRFASRATLATGEHLLWDYQFSNYARSTNSTDSNTKSTLGQNSHERYEYADSPSAWLKTESSDGKIPTVQTLLQTVQRDLTDAQAVYAEGSSNASVMLPGYTCTLAGHPQSSLNVKYLVTSVEHRCRQVPSYRPEHDAGAAGGYSNRFTAIPAAVPYRPAQTLPKPRVQGVVTGKVVAPSGDESYLDKYGRVCVQFWWDRNRKPNTTDNTLLRVAQQWAGNGWGAYYWPRLNDEVLIDFLDGDPDAPIVVGSLYNGVNLPPYPPATQYTRSGLKTRSSKQGTADNANELRFDDLKGSEQIFVNAEKDFDLHVQDTWHTQVDNEQHLTITKNRYEAIQGEHHSKVTGKSLNEVDGDLHLKVGGARMEETTGNVSEKIGGSHMYKVAAAASVDIGAALNEKVGADYSLQVTGNHFNKSSVYVVDAGEEVHLKGGLTVVIEGGMGVCLSGPGGFVSIGPEGVTIQGILVNINSGGAALEGSPAVVQSPQAPTAPTAPTAPKWPGDDPRASKEP